MANIQCCDMHTHAIVQREKDNKVVLILLDNFINFWKVVKVNDIATFKINKDSRKADRRKVLVFGEFLINKSFNKFILFILLKERKMYVSINCKCYKKNFSMKINCLKINKASITWIIKTTRMSFLIFVEDISEMASGEYFIFSLVFTGR